MSRYEFDDDCGNDPHYHLHRANVNRAIKGKRGQDFIRELIDALESIQDKKLGGSVLVDSQSNPCALGCVLQKRGIIPEGITDVSLIQEVTPDATSIANKLGISKLLACEIMFENDEGSEVLQDGRKRYKHMLAWAIGAQA